MLLNNLKLLGSSFRGLAPHVPFRNITMRTTQTTIIQRQEPAPQYTRQILKYINELPSEQEQIILDQKRKIEEEKQKAMDNKQNDRNPANHVKVKVNLLSKIKAQEMTTSPVPVETNISEKLARPFVLIKQPRPAKVTVTGLRRKVPVSLKKLLPLMRAIIGKHIYDAINLCMTTKKKSAKFILSALEMVKRHAAQRDMAEERLYVCDAITGKQKRYIRLRYHAKGKGAHMHKDVCKLLIRLEEKPIEDMYKEMIQGRTPPMLAYSLRKSLLEKDADYDMIRRNNYILTAKGRQQRRLMFKRRVIQERLAFKVNFLFLEILNNYKNFFGKPIAKQ